MTLIGRADDQNRILDRRTSLPTVLESIVMRSLPHSVT